MPLFEKVIAEAGDNPGELKDILSRKIRDKKLAEMDDSSVERQVQAERTKTAELEAREVEAGVRKTTAELSVADKLVPQGMWGLITEVLKDRNPQQPMTVQDMLAIMEYAREQQGGGVQEGPPDGMWGFLTAIMGNMANNNQTTTPTELIQLIQTVNAMGHQQQQPQNPMSQMMEMVQAFTAMKGLFGAPAQQGPTGTMVGMPGGGVMPLEDLLKYQDHSFNLELRKQDHQEKIENYRAVRENAPTAIQAITEIAQSIRLGGGKPGQQKQEQELQQIEDKRPQKEQLSPGSQQGAIQPVQCPDCKLQFSVPAELDLSKIDITCPVCAVLALKSKGEADNAQKSSQDNSQEQGSGQQAEDQGGDRDNPSG